MRKIAIVGAGQGGLQLGFGLLANGYQVTLYADRSARQVLDGRCTATAFLFHRSLAYERELGLDFWDGEVEPGEGVHLDFCPTPGNRLLAVEGRFKRPGMAIDQRLKFSRWMDELEARGGRLVVREMSVADVDAAAAEHDLVVVASGKGEISALFERDARRSVHAKPQRKLALLTLKGLARWSQVPFHAAKFTLIGTEGEIFWIPFHDKTAGSCHSLLFEAKPGSRMDRFSAARTAEEMLGIARRVVADLAPWELHRLAHVEITDPLAWATGAITPVVRRPVAHLPSGRAVTGLGDALVLNDPIAAQGANHAAKAAHFMTGRILEHGDRPFDAAWMAAGFEEFWQREARFMTRFSNLFLEPLGPPAKEVLLAASRVPAIAEEFFEGFNAPQSLWPWIEDLRLARRLVAERTGRPWLRTAAASRFAVLKGQLGQRLLPTPAIAPVPAEAKPLAPPAGKPFATRPAAEL
ncbi:MAG TPA: styrene monooxygenase/indole monooxygenase family protein [Thermoanaerobaculia bacterium]|nr:styrene monooxygenase/indole monooxygenase family protein [Thermoanaerobaculia bacterium]